MTDVLTPEQRRRNMSRIKSAGTAPERAVRDILKDLGAKRMRFNDALLPGSPDVVLLSSKRVIFVHGCYWHRHACRFGAATPATNKAFWREKFDRNVARDRSDRRQLRASGWAITTVWECQLKKPTRVRSRLARVVNKAFGE